MRRLLILLLVIAAFGAFAPPVMADALHRHDAGMAMPTGGCHDEGQCVAHVCLGCAVQPAEPPMPATPVPVALVLLSVARSFTPDHRPGFDPPPPRAIG